MRVYLLKQTSVSTWLVCGNISYGFMLSILNPESFKTFKSRAKVFGL